MIETVHLQLVVSDLDWSGAMVFGFAGVHRVDDGARGFPGLARGGISTLKTVCVE